LAYYFKEIEKLQPPSGARKLLLEIGQLFVKVMDASAALFMTAFESLVFALVVELGGLII
jgi:hypothetical protein